MRLIVISISKFNIQKDEQVYLQIYIDATLGLNYINQLPFI